MTNTNNPHDPRGKKRQREHSSSDNENPRALSGGQKTRASNAVPSNHHSQPGPSDHSWREIMDGLHQQLNRMQNALQQHLRGSNRRNAPTGVASIDGRASLSAAPMPLMVPSGAMAVASSSRSFSTPALQRQSIRTQWNDAQVSLQQIREGQLTHNQRYAPTLPAPPASAAAALTPAPPPAAAMLPAHALLPRLSAAAVISNWSTMALQHQSDRALPSYPRPAPDAPAPPNVAHDPAVERRDRERQGNEESIDPEPARVHDDAFRERSVQCLDRIRASLPEDVYREFQEILNQRAIISAAEGRRRVTELLRAWPELVDEFLEIAQPRPH